MEHPLRYDNRGGVSVVDLAGRRVVLADGYAADEILSRFSPDGTRVWVSHASRLGSVDLVSGRRETVVQIGTMGGAGMISVDWITAADDPRAYAYQADEHSSRLFQIEGVK